VLDQLRDDYDVAILDCPPSISLVSEGVFAASDLLLVPLIPSTLSVRTYEQLRTFLERGPAPDLLPFLSMVDRRKRMHRELVEELAGLADIAIPNASAVEQMGARRSPLVVTQPRGAAALAYAALWEAVVTRM
jgi:cellulose biosynthesis protein BcsQ